MLWCCLCGYVITAVRLLLYQKKIKEAKELKQYLHVEYKILDYIHGLWTIGFGSPKIRKWDNVYS